MSDAAPVAAPPATPRVLHLDYTALVGGGQHSLLELLRALPSTPPPLLACPAGPLAQRAQALGATWLEIPGNQATAKLHPLRTPLALLKMHQAARTVRDHARRNGADIVHANSVRAGLIALWARTLGGPPCITHVRDALGAGTLARVVKQVIARSDATVAISRYVAARLAPRAHHVSVVDNPVDLSRFDRDVVDAAPLRTELGLDGRGPVLTLVAQITPWKGQDRAIRTLAALREDGGDAQLLLVGEAKFIAKGTTNDNLAYERSLHALVDELELGDAVHFTGERDDVERVLAATDILLVPSTEEPFGRTIVESLAMGVPVIATTVGGPPEIVRDQVDGALLPPDDTAAWAQAAARILAARDVGGTASCTYARERFSAAHHAQRLQTIYSAVVAEKGH